MYISISPAYMSEYHIDAWCTWRLERGTGFPGIGDGCEPPCRCWELNLSPLEDQPVFSTTAKPSPQTSLDTFYKCHYGITPSTVYSRIYLCYVCSLIAICTPLLMDMWVCQCTPLLMDLAVITNKASGTTHLYTSKQSMYSAVLGVWGNSGPIADSNFPKASFSFVLMQVTVESYSFLSTSEPLLESHPTNT